MGTRQAEVLVRETVSILASSCYPPLQDAPLVMPRRWMGGARAQKATKGAIAAASSKNAARQPRGPATTPPKMYPCQPNRNVTYPAPSTLKCYVTFPAMT